MLVDSNTILPLVEELWDDKPFSRELLEEARERNKKILDQRLKRRKYSEVFVAMGRKQAAALPLIERKGLTVIFPIGSGLISKAQALKNWMRKSSHARAE